MVIFQNYALDLDAVQKIYEKHKHSPSLPRNAPPVAGDIMWARQLLRRIEEPMRKFATNETIMRSEGEQARGEDIQHRRQGTRGVRDALAAGVDQIHRILQGWPAGDPHRPTPGDW